MRIQQFQLVKSNVPDEIKRLKDERPYTNVEKLIYRHRFVAWIDILGTANTMARSLNITTNFVGKLHVAVLAGQQKLQSQCNIYPLVDGVYITSTSRDQVLKLLKHTFRSLAINFILETDAEHHFMVRSCLSHGPLIEGLDIASANRILQSQSSHSKHMVLGPGVAGAYAGERNASPFGIWIDTPVRLYPDIKDRIVSTHFPWWRYDTQPDDYLVARSLANALEDYFAWCEGHLSWILYPKEALERHRALAKDYFNDPVIREGIEMAKGVFPRP